MNTEAWPNFPLLSLKVGLLLLLLLLLIIIIIIIIIIIFLSSSSSSPFAVNSHSSHSSHSSMFKGAYAPEVSYSPSDLAAIVAHARYN